MIILLSHDVARCLSNVDKAMAMEEESKVDAPPIDAFHLGYEEEVEPCMAEGKLFQPQRLIQICCE